MKVILVGAGVVLGAAALRFGWRVIRRVRGSGVQMHHVKVPEGIIWDPYLDQLVITGRKRRVMG